VGPERGPGRRRREFTFRSSSATTKKTLADARPDGACSRVPGFAERKRNSRRRSRPGLSCALQFAPDAVEPSGNSKGIRRSSSGMRHARLVSSIKRLVVGGDGRVVSRGRADSFISSAKFTVERPACVGRPPEAGSRYATLAQPHADAVPAQLLDVRRLRRKARLDHHADGLVPGMELAHQVESAAGVGAGFHVDAHKEICRGGLPDESFPRWRRQSPIEKIQAKLRQLQGHVAADAGLMNRRQCAQIHIPRRDGFPPRDANALAQAIESDPRCLRNSACARRRGPDRAFRPPQTGPPGAGPPARSPSISLRHLLRDRKRRRLRTTYRLPTTAAGLGYYWNEPACRIGPDFARLPSWRSTKSPRSSPVKSGARAVSDSTWSLRARRGVLDAVMRRFGRVPRHCRFCEKRFFVRAAASAPNRLKAPKGGNGSPERSANCPKLPRLVFARNSRWRRHGGGN